MENILLKEYQEYETIKNDEIKLDKHNSLSPTTSLLLTCTNLIDIEKIDGIRKINEYDETDKFENELLTCLNIPKTNKTTISFIFHELIGNIYDHSQFNNGFLMGKQYGEYHEISFIDDGITIPKSLKNADFMFENDWQSIIEAINGLSTKNDLGYIERGTGLNNTTNIILNGGHGSILIVSGCGLVHMTKNQILTKELKNCLNGTLISLRIKLKNKIDIYNYLNQITYKY